MQTIHINQSLTFPCQLSYINPQQKDIEIGEPDEPYTVVIDSTDYCPHLPQCAALGEFYRGVSPDDPDELVLYKHHIERFCNKDGEPPPVKCNLSDIVGQISLHEHRHSLLPAPTTVEENKLLEIDAKEFAYDKYKEIFGEEPPLVRETPEGEERDSELNPDYRRLGHGIYNEVQAFHEEDDEDDGS